MIKTDTNSNAQSWELEIICKNKQYLDEVVNAILKYGVMNFEVENIELCRYSVLIWCSWFNNLKSISNDLAEIEKRLD